MKITRDQNRKKQGTIIKQMMANEAITDLSSKAFRKLPAIEKCLKAKYPAMANETITPV